MSRSNAKSRKSRVKSAVIAVMHEEAGSPELLIDEELFMDEADVGNAYVPDFDVPPRNTRRTIEILREQKMLRDESADLSDYLI